MLYVQAIKLVKVLLIVLPSIIFSANINQKKFDVETGMVLFEIAGRGQLTEDINITVKGEGKLRFRDWGVEALVEEKYVEVSAGAINHINKVQICEKFENKQRFNVNFETEKIFDRPMPKGNFKDYYLKGLQKTGQEEIAGYTCDVWEGEGVKKCLYEGIPLLVEYYLFGVYYQKKAVEVKLNIKVSPSQCALPDFPVEKFALFKTNIKTKSIKLPKELSSVIRTVTKELHTYLEENKCKEEELNPQQKRFWLDKLGQNIFENQKKYLPKFLDTLKNARVCLQQAGSTNEANACILEVLNMKKQSSENVENKIESWDDRGRAKVLDSFDDTIFLLESKMKCIRGAQKLSDLSVCMK